MSYPLVAIVGRPNVGKSTLANRLAGKQTAIVDEQPGVTRDRNYLSTEWNGRTFTIIDTGGIDFEPEMFAEEIRSQAGFAINEADLTIVLVDGAAGITGPDHEIADMLRQSGKPVFLVVNKVDNPSNDMAAADFYELGLGEPKVISALHGIGTGDLLDDITAALPEVSKEAEADEAVKIAIIGRPNVGKSTLFNRILGFERSIVTDIPGTTRDSIDTQVRIDNNEYLLIDTAGMRRKSRVEKGVEYYTNIRTIRSIDKADIVLLVIDSIEGITVQDQKLADFAVSHGCGIIVLLNKWDAVEKDHETIQTYEEDLDRVLGFISYAPYISISGLTGQRVSKIFATVEIVFEQYRRRVSTNKLLAFVKHISQSGHVHSKGGQALRFSYAVQAGTKPPEFIFFVNHPQLVDDSYTRYIENQLRQEFGLTGTPLKIYFRKKA